MKRALSHSALIKKEDYISLTYLRLFLNTLQIWVIQSLAAIKAWYRALLVKTPFLNAVLYDLIYMRQPRGFEGPENQNHVFKQKK